MLLTIAGKNINVRDTKNTYTFDLSSIKDTPEYSKLSKTSSFKKSYIVIKKIDHPNINLNNLQDMVNKIINISTPATDVVNITVFEPRRDFLSVSYLILFPNGTKKAFFEDCRNKSVADLVFFKNRVFKYIRTVSANSKISSHTSLKNPIKERAAFLQGA